MQETCIQLRISPSKVLSLLKSGYLVGMKIPGAGGKFGQWRICDPGPKLERWLRECEERLIHLPLLSIREVAAVTGYDYDLIASLVRRGKLKSAAREGKRRIRLFTVAEVRRLLSKRGRMVRPTSRVVQLETLIEWSTELLAKQNAENAANVQEPAKDRIAAMMDKIERLPEPYRTDSLLALYRKLDQCQLLNATRKADYERLKLFRDSLPEQEARADIH
jgi:hypothetical protein